MATSLAPADRACTTMMASEATLRAGERYPRSAGACASTGVLAIETERPDETTRWFASGALAEQKSH